jgi:hypothetical protein
MRKNSYFEGDQISWNHGELNPFSPQRSGSTLFGQQPYPFPLTRK